MPTNIQTIKNFPALIKYLRTDLGWPVDEEQVDDLTFDYEPDELGLDKDSAVKVRAAKQLRPLVSGQPWGIFWIDFEPKKLPVTVMRRILNQLVAKKRGGNPNQATWNLDDLLFISAVGSEKSDRREITFAHFHQEAGDLPTLRVLGWDGADTVLKIDYVAKTLKEKLLWPQNPKDVQAWRETWAEAFKHKPGHVIRTAGALAERLAELARRIRSAAETIMAHESERGVLRKLHKAFQTALIHDLTEADFADTYAQTITYGLLTAAISRTDMSGGADGTALVAENITEMVPVTNPFLKEMLGTFLHAGGRRGNGRSGIDFDELGIQDVVELLRSDETDLPAILRDFNNRAEGEDPVIRFYEDFLEAYDKALKVQRGVFYTPKPVVSYIVRGVHELLQSEFGLEDGLAATMTWGEMVARNAEVKIPKGVAANSFFVMILDPATGTATFLVEVIDVIYKTMVAKWKKQGYKDAQIQAAWNEYVPTSLLPRLYGYELMMAPYAIAHMKIGLKLYETGYRFASDQRANIYLTNALEEPSQLAQGSAASLFEALGHESQAVNDVKRSVYFTVAIGNPPYSGHSANASKNVDGSLNFIGNLLQDYYKLDGMPLGESNTKWLQDDYVKFIRFTQSRITQSGLGISSMITNHGYLDNPTFRGMRRALMQNFDNIYALDVHGNTKKRDVAPDGSKDENVFDIQQGVAIHFFVKQAGSNSAKKISHADLYGLRDYKYEWLQSHRQQFAADNWDEINPIASFYFFIHQSLDLRDEYNKGWSLADIFKVYSLGIITKRDFLVTDTDSNALLKRIKEFADKSVSNAETAKLFNLSMKDNDKWDLVRARKHLQTNGVNKADIRKILYRPFDMRYVYYDSELVARLNTKVMSHLDKPNFALIVGRQGGATGSEIWDVAFATNQLVDQNVFRRGGGTVFPLYLYEDNAFGLFATSSSKAKTPERTSNVNNAFLQEVEKGLKAKYTTEPLGNRKDTFGLVELFYYIYATLFSNSYRTRYAEFLSLDFPKIPIPKDFRLFNTLADFGQQLYKIHTLEVTELSKEIGIKSTTGSNMVDSGYPTYSAETQSVFINDSQEFKGISQEVWEFEFGGYQVCYKWLKDRQKTKLSENELEIYKAIIWSISKTCTLMNEVDEIIFS